MEIPTKIRFDVFLVLLGIALIIVPTQFTLLPNHFLEIFSVLIGSIFLLNGINLIKYEYDLERELLTFDYVQRKVEYIKYFKRENLLLNNTEERNRKQVLQIIN
jgi:hypothetical protein